MGLHIQRKQLRRFRLLSTLVAVLAFAVQPLVSLNLPAAFAIDAQPSITPTSHVLQGGGIAASQVTSTVSGTGYKDMKVSLHYDATHLDSNETFEFGITGDDVTKQTVTGVPGNHDSEETDAEIDVPAAYNNSTFTVYFKDNGNLPGTTGNNDVVNVTNLAVSGSVIPAPTIQTCATTNTVNVASVDNWYDDSRSSGHSDMTTGGLHVWTDSNTSNDKAAKYLYGGTASFDLKDAGTPSIDIADGFTGGRPSLQLAFDKDGNGNWDGYLVYEPWAYGEGQYWSNKDFGVGAGGGYPSMGTLQDYLDANPSARIIGVGYSLGSGVKGDAVIKSLTAGCTKYVFAAPVLDTEKPTATLTEPAVNSYNPTQMVVDAHDETSLKAVTANIYNATNTTLIKSCSNNAGGAKDYTLTCPVPDTLTDGIYTIRANASDNAGHTAATTIRQFTVDHTAPKITVKTGSSFTQGSDGVYKKVSFSLYDKYKVAKYDINGTVTNVSPNQYSDANYITVGSRGAVYGANTITLYDMAGNSVDLDFVLDNVGPTITVKDGYVGDKDERIFSNVSFSLYDLYKVDKYDINGHVSDFSDNKWSDANFQNIEQYLVQGNNTLTLYDVVGNPGTYAFTFDNVAPDATFTYDPSNNDVKKGPVTVTLHATEPIQQPAGWDKTDNSTYTKTETANGQYHVTITDLAGNSKELTYEVKRIDNTNPVINVASGTRNSNLPAYTVTDQNLEKVTLNGTKQDCVYSGSNYVWNCPGVSGDGTYTITAIDKAGNPDSVTFTIDSTAPKVTVEQPPAVKSGEKVTLHGTIDDPAATLTVTIDGVPYAGVIRSGNDWSLSVDTTSLTTGNHPVIVSSADTYGNRSTDQTTTLAIASPVTSPLPHSIVPGRGGLIAPGVTTSGTNGTGTPNATPSTANDDTAVLGTKDDSGKAPADTTASVVKPSEQGWKVLGLAWYWWLLILAALAAAWWWFAAARRRAEETA